MNFKKRLWTSDDDAALAREIVAGKSAIEIAEKIGRTPSAVQSRVRVLGMTFRKMRLKKSRKELAPPASELKADSSSCTVQAGNYDDIRGCHYPKGEITDDWYSDEDPHNGNHNQHDCHHEPWPDRTILHAVNAEPQ